MRKITGTIVTLRQFLENKDTEVKIDAGSGEQYSVILLKENRQYVIPSFQRELRWKEKQVVEIIRDIQSSDKFLGNMILNKNNNNYEVIDGQQRITVIYMILDFLNNTYGKDQEIFNKCELILQNFKAYKKFAENGYGKNLSAVDESEIFKDDYYGQSSKFSDLYELIPKYLDTKQKALIFYRNLCNCTVNIIVSNDDGVSNQGIEYFLDVNLKGMKLDDEDIFKGYLFSLDNSEEMISKWNDIKKLIFEINRQEKETKYELCSFLQHFMYSYIYDFDKYKDIDFGNDFLIQKDVSVDGDVHYSGEHVVKVIWSKDFFLKMLSEAKTVLELIEDVIKNSTGVSSTLKQYLELSAIDSTEYPVISNYLSKILLDDKLIFKSLVVKYLKSLIEINDNMAKKEKVKITHEIYAIILFIGLYLMFNYKKDIKNLIPILREKDFHEKIISEINKNLTCGGVVDFTVDDNEKSQKYMAKIIASIYDYYYLDNNIVKIRNSKYTELKKFLDDIDDYSIEHLLINNSKEYKIKSNNKEYKYPESITKKYRNSIFNYIFIPKSINNNLSNYDINTKLKLLEDSKAQINDEYSKNYIKLAKGAFKDLSETKYDDENEQKRYFSFDFLQREFIQFKSKLVESIVNRVKS